MTPVQAEMTRLNPNLLGSWLIFVYLSLLNALQTPGPRWKLLRPRDEVESFLPTATSLLTIPFTFFAQSLSQIQSARADDTVDANNTFLSTRVSSLAANKVKCGIRQTDVFYPDWFQGTWRSESTFDNFFLPLGVDAAGGQRYVDKNIKGILNSKLEYLSTFVRSSDGGSVISDRLRNVRSIGMASMGMNSTLQMSPIPQDNLAARMEFLIRPAGANGTAFDIALITSDRDQRRVNDRRFEVIERTEQIIATMGTAGSRPLVKETETVTCYEKINDDKIVAKQRTATFLSPSDPRYSKIRETTPLVDNAAIDIRYYTLVMTR